MKEAIEQLIEDYERKVRSAIATLDDPVTPYEKRVRVQSRRLAFNKFILELKAVLANETSDTGNAANHE